MSPRKLIGTLMVTALLAACGHSGNDSDFSIGDSNLLDGGIHVHDGKATLHAHGAPDAVISAAGELTIGQQSVVVNDAQRNLLQQYYQHVVAVRQHGIETGKAGAAIAGQAISSVAKGVVSGNADQIDKDIQAKTDDVTKSAMKICSDIAGIKTTQDGLASQLPAFKPYALIVGEHEVADCENDSKEDR